PQANAEAFTADGWFRTGDLAVVADDAGNLRIVGGWKEIMNRGGKKFFPREVEEILYTHPKVLHAAMVGVADPRLGERNCLCVVPKNGAAVSLDEFTDFLRDQVATYKLPERLEVLDELPFTPTGKIQRCILQRQIEARDKARQYRRLSFRVPSETREPGTHEHLPCRNDQPVFMGSGLAAARRPGMTGRGSHGQILRLQGVAFRLEGGE